MWGMVRAMRHPAVAMFLLVMFLYGAGVPMPSLPIVVLVAVAVGWVLGKRRPHDGDDGD